MLSCWKNWSNRWQESFEIFVRTELAKADPGHDWAHVRRVVHSATLIGQAEGAASEIVLPAAWLHDCVIVPKNSADRKRASQLAAIKAIEFLKVIEYPIEFAAKIKHAIEAHSFSANIPPNSIDAKVVQDADRLEALGAIGLARCLMTGVTMGVDLMNEVEPFPIQRQPDDSRNSLDHFFIKLLQLPATMQTAAGKQAAIARAEFLKLFLKQLASELYIDEQVLNQSLQKWCS